jgi:hypothetical protein
MVQIFAPHDYEEIKKGITVSDRFELLNRSLTIEQQQQHVCEWQKKSEELKCERDQYGTELELGRLKCTIADQPAVTEKQVTRVFLSS